MHHEHPVRIIRYSLKHIWLLTFPLLRSVLTRRASPELLAGWLYSSGLDLFILLLILGFGWLHWHCRTFSVQRGILCVREGVLFRRKRTFPIDRLSVLTFEAPLWLRPFGGMYVCADTDAGSRRRHDLRLLIRSADAEMFRRPLPPLSSASRISGHIRVHPFRVLLFSVIFSSSLSGALYTAAFWFQGGRIFRSLITELSLIQRLDAVSQEASRRLAGIPPAAAAVGIVILSLWLLSLIRNLLRYGKFTMQTDQRLIFVQSGILTQRSFLLRHDRISFLDLRQSLPTRLFRLYSAAVSCAGYGSQRGTIPVCLPLLTERELADTLPLLSAGAVLRPNQIKAPLTAWWGFVWAPVTGLAAVLPAAWVLGQLLPQFGDAIGFLRVMLLIPIGWKLLVQLTALLTNGFAVNDSRICLRYCRGFVFHTILADTGNIVKVTLTQLPWQRWFGKCNAVFSFRTEQGRRCILKNLEQKQLIQLLEEAGISTLCTK